MSKAHFTLLYLLYTRTDRFGGLKQQQQIFFFYRGYDRVWKETGWSCNPEDETCDFLRIPGQFMLHIEFQASLGIEGTQSQKWKWKRKDRLKQTWRSQVCQTVNC